jgi:ligand-binding sensor domain-containing protein
MGSDDGSLSVRRPETGAWSVLRDIQLSDRVQKGIRLLRMEGDSLFVGTDFGLSVFLLNRWEFGDTYANFGFAVSARVWDVRILHDTLWVATDRGIARAPRRAANLSSPTLWQRFTVTEGLPAANVQALEVFRDTLVAGTSAGAAFFRNGGFEALTQVGSGSVVDLELVGGNLGLLVRNVGTTVLGLSRLTDAAAVVAVNASAAATDLAADGSGEVLWVGTATLGVARWTGSAWTYHRPNAPASNLFISVAADPEGIVWGASGANGGGRGFYRFDPNLPAAERWKSYTKAEYPALLTDDYYKASIGRDGQVWISSWGWGVAELRGDTLRRLINASTSPSLAGAVPQDPWFVVVGSAAVDDEGTTWFVTRTPVDGNVLARLTGDTVLVKYKNDLNPTEGRFTAMVVDRNGTKWLANSEWFNKAASGLYWFNERKVVPGTESTAGWGLMTIADGLPNNNVLSLAVDLEGQVCVGTDLGMMIITDPLLPRQRRVTSFPLREQVVQAIAVDGVNNKWVGTKEGLFLVNQDGTQLLQQFTVASTSGKLVDNDIRSLAIDGKQGILYAGTEKGLSALGIAPVQTARTASTLHIAPNPFLIPSDLPVEIRTLVPESQIKILSVAGAVVAEFRAQGGGRAFWNGRNDAGALVASGVYFIVASAENGDQIGTGKVTVVRR